MRFEIPEAWVRWYNENSDAHPNLHLSPAELNVVKETEGEWDREFALIVNAILPFEQCVAHTGGEGWGPFGISFADLQVRAYVLTAMPEEVEERACSLGAAVVTDFTGTHVVPLKDRARAWRRTGLEYLRMYGDYGATAVVDLRVQRFGNRTVAFAFMYTDQAEHDSEIKAILDSIVFADV